MTLVLGLAALLVPADRRRDWLAEWQSELWYVRHARLRFCLGAFADAYWIRAEAPRPRISLQTPARCLSVLTVLAATAVGLYLYTPDHPIQPADAWMPLIALLFVPFAPVLLDTASPARAHRLRAHLFLAVKCVFIFPIVHGFTFGLAPLIAANGAQHHASLVGYALAFRWAVQDQRRRCPVCLRRLSNPASVGQPASTLLDWYGTEYLCAHGHGSMQVPEIKTTYRPQRWLDLDPAWRTLFRSQP